MKKKQIYNSGLKTLIMYATTCMPLNLDTEIYIDPSLTGCGITGTTHPLAGL